MVHVRNRMLCTAEWLCTLLWLCVSAKGYIFTYQSLCFCNSQYFLSAPFPSLSAFLPLRFQVLFLHSSLGAIHSPCTFSWLTLRCSPSVPLINVRISNYSISHRTLFSNMKCLFIILLVIHASFVLDWYSFEALAAMHCVVYLIVTTLLLVTKWRWSVRRCSTSVSVLHKVTLVC